MNLLKNFSPEKMAEYSLSWNPAPLSWEPLPEGGIRVVVPAQVDYFRDPVGIMMKDNAPFLSMSVTGDFVAQAHVRPTFASTYDSGVIMARHDEKHWAKVCFEKTDFGTIAAVSVVTRELSDDANGTDLNVPDLWLQMVRSKNVFAVHYALDGKQWRMVRLFHLDVPPAIRVGIVAQCPVGPGTTIDFLSFSIEQRTVQNARSGI
ncbi:MAG: DUF1349 domain-containing protein [Anaerolineaceae bacterium]|nr:DUF1349 domain-containing protein [Anaerolineaceae bacterium]